MLGIPIIPTVSSKNIGLKDIFEKKRGFVDSVLKKLSKEINEYIITFEKKGNEASQKIEDKYQNYKSKLAELIMEKLGYNF